MPEASREKQTVSEYPRTAANKTMTESRQNDTTVVSFKNIVPLRPQGSVNARVAGNKTVAGQPDEIAAGITLGHIYKLTSAQQEQNLSVGAAPFMNKNFFRIHPVVPATVGINRAWSPLSLPQTDVFAGQPVYPFRRQIRTVNENFANPAEINIGMAADGPVNTSGNRQFDKHCMQRKILLRFGRQARVNNDKW